MPFRERQKEKEKFSALPFNLKDYIELMDWTGRCARNDKRGFIPASQPKILLSLALTEAQWKVLALEIQKQSTLMLHGLDKLSALEQRQAEKNNVAA